MKGLAAVIAVAALAAGFYFAFAGEAADRSTEVAPAAPVATTDAPAEPAELTPVELVDVFDGSEIDEGFKPALEEGDDVSDIKKSRILKQEVYPDGSAYVEVASPLFYGDGRKKTVIRRMHAVPTTMSEDYIQVRKFTENDRKAGRRQAGQYLIDRRARAERDAKKAQQAQDD